MKTHIDPLSAARGIHAVASLLADDLYNAQVDRPLGPETLSAYQNFAENVRQLSIALVARLEELDDAIIHASFNDRADDVCQIQVPTSKAAKNRKLSVIDGDREVAA